VAPSFHVVGVRGCGCGCARVGERARLAPALAPPGRLTGQGGLFLSHPAATPRRTWHGACSAANPGLAHGQVPARQRGGAPAFARRASSRASVGRPAAARRGSEQGARPSRRVRQEEQQRRVSLAGAETRRAHGARRPGLPRGLASIACLLPGRQPAARRHLGGCSVARAQPPSGGGVTLDTDDTDIAALSALHAASRPASLPRRLSSQPGRDRFHGSFAPSLGFRVGFKYRRSLGRVTRSAACSPIQAALQATRQATEPRPPDL